MFIHTSSYRMLQLNNELDRKEYTFRVGNLIFHELGQIPLNTLEKFADTEHVFPVSLLLCLFNMKYIFCEVQI